MMSCLPREGSSLSHEHPIKGHIKTQAEAKLHNILPAWVAWHGQGGGAHLHTEGVGVAGSQAPHAVVGDAVVQLPPGLGALLLARLLQGVVLAVGAVLRPGTDASDPWTQHTDSDRPGAARRCRLR